MPITVSLGETDCGGSWRRCGVIVPFRFPVQVSHQAQEPPFQSLPAQPGIQQGALRRRRGMCGRTRARCAPAAACAHVPWTRGFAKYPVARSLTCRGRPRWPERWTRSYDPDADLLGLSGRRTGVAADGALLPATIPTSTPPSPGPGNLHDLPIALLQV